MENIKYLVWLNMAFTNDYETIWGIINEHDTLENAYSSVVSGNYKLKLSNKKLEKLNETSLEKAEEVVAYCAENSISIIRYGSDSYPVQLKSIEYPPPVLYVRGDISCLSQGKNITCAGTRKPSGYTVSAISGICTELVNNGFTIISGFAEGCDINANLPAINLDRPTVCVLGCGIDVDYPKPNHPYREQIIKNGGLFISEYTPLESSRPFRFPKRNVILVALSDMTVVFEADEKSGSLRIAEEAVRQNKKLLCIPPADIFDDRYAGNIKLLRTCAEPLYSTEDVFRIYGVETSARAETADCTDVPAVSSQKTAETRKTDKTRKDTGKNKPEKPVEETTVAEIPEGSFTPKQQKILDLLDSGILHIDTIVQKLDVDISEIIVEIMELQVNGVIEEMAGSHFRKC